MQDVKAETEIPDCGAARALQNGPSDSGLDRLAELWPMLSELDRLALVGHAEHLVTLRSGGEEVAVLGR